MENFIKKLGIDIIHPLICVTLDDASVIIELHQIKDGVTIKLISSLYLDKYSESEPREVTLEKDSKITSYRQVMNYLTPILQTANREKIPPIDIMNPTKEKGPVRLTIVYDPFSHMLINTEISQISYFQSTVRSMKPSLKYLFLSSLITQQFMNKPVTLKKINFDIYSREELLAVYEGILLANMY